MHFLATADVLLLVISFWLANFVCALQKLSEAFRLCDLKAAERIITDLRYVTRTGEAIAKKLP